MSPSTFDQAIHTVITAVARYHRCGPDFRLKSEAYWVFVAGSYDRQMYEEAVRAAVERLPEMKSFEDDLRVARRLVEHAIKMLDGVDERDSMDLAEAMVNFDDYRRDS